LIEKLVNTAAKEFGFPHYIAEQNLIDKLNILFRNAFGCDADSYYDFYHEPLFHSALVANVKGKKCLLTSEDATALKKVGKNIKTEYDFEIKEIPWSETPLPKSEAKRSLKRRTPSETLTL
jgi:hypothetical protein